MNARKNLQMIVTVILLIMAAACSIFEKDVPAPQSFSLRLERPADASPQLLATQKVTMLHSEKKKYAKSIRAFRINNITYAVKEYAGSDAPVISGNLDFAPAGSDAYHRLADFQHLDLKAIAASGAEVVLPITDTAAQNKLAALMQRGSDVTFRLQAQTNGNPVAATLVLHVDAQMTVAL